MARFQSSDSSESMASWNLVGSGDIVKSISILELFITFANWCSAKRKEIWCLRKVLLETQQKEASQELSVKKNWTLHRGDDKLGTIT